MAGRLRLSSRAQRAAYWVVAAALIALGLWAGPALDRIVIWTPVKHWAFRSVARLTRRLEPDNTVVVTIGDDEFWKGPLAGRRPIKRDYIAALVRKLLESRPMSIGIDLRFDAPMPDGSLRDFADYEEETRPLLAVLSAGDLATSIVLARTFPTDGRPVRLNASALPIPDPLPPKVSWGHIMLPRDVRLVPSVARLDDGTSVDSFARALVLGANRNADYPADDRALGFGEFIDRSRFTQVPAAEVLASRAGVPAVRNRIVLVGATWHDLAWRLGAEVDSHPSPYGLQPGVFLHATYVENVLQHRVKPRLSEGIGHVLEALLALAVAITFALEMKRLSRLALLLGLPLLTFAASYFFWQNLGLFFDSVLPVLLITAHGIVEYARDQRERSRQQRDLIERLQTDLDQARKGQIA